MLEEGILEDHHLRDPKHVHNMETREEKKETCSESNYAL